MINGKTDLSRRCQNRIRCGLAPDRGTFPDGEFQKAGKEGRRELLDGAVGLVRDDGKAEPLLFQRLHHRKDAVIGSGLDEAVGVIPGLVEREHLRLQRCAAVRGNAVLYQISGPVAEALTHMLTGYTRKREFRKRMIDGIVKIIQSVQNGSIHIEENSLISHQIRIPRFFASKRSSSRKSGCAMEISCFTREESVWPRRWAMPYSVTM